MKVVEDERKQVSFVVKLVSYQINKKDKRTYEDLMNRNRIGVNIIIGNKEVMRTMEKEIKIVEGNDGKEIVEKVVEKIVKENIKKVRENFKKQKEKS